MGSGVTRGTARRRGSLVRSPAQLGTQPRSRECLSASWPARPGAVRAKVDVVLDPDLEGRVQARDADHAAHAPSAGTVG